MLWVIVFGKRKTHFFFSFPIVGKDDSHNAMVPLLPYGIGLSNLYNEIYPNCEEEFKAHGGMIFDSMEEEVEFYKRYAHHIGFSVTII